MSLVRSKWLSYLAKSSESDLVGLYESTGLDPSYTYLRKPEIGTIMATARIGNTGQKFNAGEISVTRCSIQLEDGKLVGHGYVQGRSKKKSTVAALCDALMQSDKRTLIESKIVIKLKEIEKKRHDLIKRKAEKTKVDFFTLVRGEDEK